MKVIAISIIAVLVISTLILIKYKPAYEVFIAGESKGFVTEKELLDSEINDFINETVGNVAFVEVKDMPEYEYTLLKRSQKTSDAEILKSIKDDASITYKTYAITVGGEKKAEVSTEEEANKIIENVKSSLKSGVTMDFGINAEYSSELACNSSEEALASLNKIKTQKEEEYDLAQKKAAEEAARKAAASYSGSYTPTVVLASAGSIGDLQLKAPVSGMISSRFGDRSGVRRSTHTGTDIAAPMGTAVTAAAEGTVASAGWNGSYGNCIIINHVNGVQTWYAHLSKINVSVGQQVNTSTVIGNVGSTGNSTGPHLHLEVRINGTPVNPQNYLYK